MKAIVNKMQGKRNGSVKHMAREAADTIRFKAVSWSSDYADGFVIMTDVLTGKKTAMNPKIMYALESVDHLWNICMFVFCRDSKGEGYTRSYETQAPYKCRQSDLVDSLNDRHMELIKGVNSKDVETIAWVASVAPLSSTAAMKQLGMNPADWDMTREVTL